MRYAISYVSTADPDLTKNDIKGLLEEVAKHNNGKNINGVLLCSDSNFFQLIEGEEVKIKELYSHIENDPRHTNIIKIVDKPVIGPSCDGFICGVVTPETKYNTFELENYFKHIQFLDSKTEKAVKRVIEAIII